MLLPIDSSPARRHLAGGATTLLCLALTVAACSSDPGGQSVAVPEDFVEQVDPTRATFDPANFVDPTTSTNSYHPLTPGMQWVRAGTTEVGERAVPHQVISTITDVVREIDGVPAVAMLDQSTDSGEISQVGFDYMAVDKDGNVWIIGGYTEEYEGGEFTNAEDAWLGTANGAEPGVLLPGLITMETPRWFIGSVEPDSSGAVAEPAEVGISKCVEFGCFDDVVVIREGEFGAIDNEFKYYAPGIGVILNVPKDQSIHQDSFELVNMVELTPDGLAEASQVVLDLEIHARETSPDIYTAEVPDAERER